MVRPANLAFAILFTLAACAAAHAQRSGPSIPISRTVHGQVRYAQGGAPAENVDFLQPRNFYLPFNMRLGVRFEF